MGLSRRTFACWRHEELIMFCILAMFRLVFTIRVVMLNFLINLTIGSNCFFIPYYKTLKIFTRFLLSISISGDSASDFLDIKKLISSVIYIYLK